MELMHDDCCNSSEKKIMNKEGGLPRRNSWRTAFFQCVRLKKASGAGGRIVKGMFVECVRLRETSGADSRTVEENNYMNLLLQLLKSRKTELETAIKKANIILKEPVEGHLDITTRKGSFVYCLETQGAQKGTRHKQYIPSKKKSVAKKIATYDYTKILVTKAEKELKAIQETIKWIEHNDAYNCHAKLHKGRQALVSPLLLSDEEFARNWLLKHGGNYIKNSYPFKKVYITENGESSLSTTYIHDIIEKTFR